MVVIVLDSWSVKNHFRAIAAGYRPIRPARRIRGEKARIFFNF
jgi:hypothetical protein